MFSKLKVGQRLFIGSALLCLLAALLAWIGYREIQQLRIELDGVPELVDTRVTLTSWQGQTATNAARALAILRTSDVGLAEQLAPAMKETSENISVLQGRIESLALGDEAKAALATAA